MKRIRGRVIILACWLVGFCSVERLLEPIDIGDFTYLFAMVMMIFALIAPRLIRIPFWALLIAPIMIFYAIRIWMLPLVGSTAVLLSIVEASGILITSFLAYRVSLAISEFENAVAQITIGHRERGTEDVSLGAASLYREVRRARNHQRPLALLAVAMDEKSLRLNLDRIVQEAQLAMKKQYALSVVARLLCDKLEDCDTIVQNNENFLVLLPEMTPEDLPGLIDRLRRQASEQVGVELNIGAASLPQDSYTLEGLVDQATRGIKKDLAPEFLLDLKRISVDRQVH